MKPSPGDRAHDRTAWGQVVLASILMLATLPGRTQGLGLVTEPLLSDLRLDRVAYANLNLWATLLGAFACLPVGWTIDRFGLRWVTAVITAALGITVWKLGAVSGGLPILFSLLLATRALGQSALSVCSIATVGKWFERRIGLAMGVYSLLMSVLFAGAFVAVGLSVSHNGWRAAWHQIAVALIFGITPLVVLALREPPRGKKHSHASEEDDTAIADPAAGWTFARALRTRAFWVFAGAAAVFNLVSSGLGLFNEAVLAERGFDQATYHRFLAASTLMSLVGQFGCGWLSARYRFPVLTMAPLALYAVGLACIPWVQAMWQLWLAATVLGISGGMIVVVFFSVWSEAFGRLQLGRIQGAAQMLTVLASGLGPVLFARCAERYHSYTPLLIGLGSGVTLLALAAGTIRLPIPRPFFQPSTDGVQPASILP